MKIHHGLEDLPSIPNAVLTIGSFDGVHRGHQQLLKRIKGLAEEIDGESVLLTFDPHPREVIFPKDNTLQLLSTTREKLDLLGKYGIDHVVVIPFSIEFSQQSPQEYIQKVLVEPFDPAYIVIGYDHRFGLNRQGDLSMLKQYGDQYGYAVVEVHKQEIDEIAISSTKIRTALLDGDIIQAHLLAGHHYQLTGRVVTGDQIGRTLGFPTANIKPNHNKKLIPAYGVYAIQIAIEETSQSGMLYIGNRPTIDDHGKTVIEAHIFDFDQDIYGKEITVEIIEHIRGDQVFADKASLSQQLLQDKIAAEQVLRLYAADQDAEKATKILCTQAILNYNGQEYLESYLPSLLESSMDYATDILVIDNASTDDSIDYLAEWHPEVTVKPLRVNYGFAGGYNKGLQGLDSKYVVIINSDVRVTAGWLDPILRRLESDPTIAAIQPKIRSIEDPTKFEYAGAAGGWMDKWGYPFCRGRVLDYIEHDEGQYDTPAEIAWSSGACMVIRKQVFDQLAGFDADYFAHQEEIDLCYRIRSAGYRILCEPASVVYHLGGGTLAYESPRKTFLNFKNNTATLLKNENIGKLLWLLPLRGLLDKIAALKFVVDGKAGNGVAVIKALWHNYTSLPTTWRKRRYYRRLVEKARIGSANRSGEINGSLLWRYYIAGSRTWADISQKQKDTP